MGTLTCGVWRTPGYLQRVQWVAVYDGVRLGAVYQYPVGHAYNGSKSFQNEFWNRAYDHKLYFRTDSFPPKGQSMSFVYNVSAFQAEPAAWIQASWQCSLECMRKCS